MANVKPTAHRDGWIAAERIDEAAEAAAAAPTDPLPELDEQAPALSLSRPRSTGFHLAQLQQRLATTALPEGADVAATAESESILRTIADAAAEAAAVSGAGEVSPDLRALAQRIAQAVVSAIQAGGDDLPPAPAARPLPVEGYAVTFGAASYVGDGASPKLLELVRHVVDRAPDRMAGSKLARALDGGRLERDDIVELQRFLTERGFSVGSTGADGLYGPRTHAALKAFLQGLPPDKTQAPGTARSPSTTTPTADEPVRTSTPPATRAPAPTTRAVPGERSFRGDGIPPSLQAAFRKAKGGRWDKSGSCLQFAGTMASKAGAKKKTAYPHVHYPPPLTAFRGRQIKDLPEAVERGLLKPGMLVHVKLHSELDPAYHSSKADAHHWFVYMGKDRNGVPRFADRSGVAQTAEYMYRRMKTWKNSRLYGDRKHGYVPTITAFHDPFKDKRA